jgi:hypothetical protein
VQPESGATVAEAEHVYQNERPQAYDVVLTVSGMTDAGTTEGTDHVRIGVLQPAGLGASEFNPGGAGKGATRALASIGAVTGEVLIWTAVLSPLWLIAGAILFFVYRNRKRDQRAIRMRRSGPEQGQA